MADITYRSNLTRDLTPNEVDANFRSLDTSKAETTVTDALEADLEDHKEASNPHSQYLLKTDYVPPRTTDVQVFTASGTYVKPAGAKSIHLLLIGGGGGGDSGQVTDPGSWALGGKSGGGGAVFMATVDASVVADSVAVTPGAGGIGGAPSATSTINFGAAGNDTTFGYFSCNGASTADFAGWSYTSGMFHGGPRVRPDSDGGPSASRDSLSVVNGGFAVGMPPGSSGAGISDADVASTGGGPHHYSLMVHPGNVSSSPGDLNGSDARAYLDGSSGAGGGASTSANGTDGGHGGNYGTGGGGGGAARTGFMSGAGGDGAPGVAVITTFF